jgi:alkanesulfonate monooxygenase SsuD/methylene tetrahydromethanopterin reductase-like flavin-dependent oxidoreductase (luciferase family)
MAVEFIGAINTHEQSEIRHDPGPLVDLEYTRRITSAHEASGFDRVLVATASLMPEATQVAAYAAQHTERIGFLVSHRPGFVAPTVAARTFASLDQFAGGRIALHTITGGADAEMRRDGDHLTKDESYARTDEYLDILKLAWTADKPFDYHGIYYTVDDYWTGVRRPQRPRIPLSFGGSSEAAPRGSVSRASCTASSAGSAPTGSDRSARSGWSPPPRRASCTIAACGRRSPPSPAAAATRPPSSAARRPSRRRSLTTGRSASRPS